MNKSKFELLIKKLTKVKKYPTDRSFYVDGNGVPASAFGVWIKDNPDWVKNKKIGWEWKGTREGCESVNIYGAMSKDFEISPIDCMRLFGKTGCFNAKTPEDEISYIKQYMEGYNLNRDFSVQDWDGLVFTKYSSDTMDETEDIDDGTVTINADKRKGCRRLSHMDEFKIFGDNNIYKLCTNTPAKKENGIKYSYIISDAVSKWEPWDTRVQIIN